MGRVMVERVRRETPGFCGQNAIANPNSSAGFGANIVEKACSGGLYINGL
jgi:hypothetical protein